ncbi:uncharacterized protein J7T54_003344 [Emericellopsis cladophorae]|uniref:Uncharacterized protein n=1 Tax=Emericellopsis cladophorae TaxID=2686198 RepID=A0A9Q0B979_9HYPO|nr:uncharacterized protein J7T54_003344 [Emericellopsis cladophorae]KAI6778337.1 hypothetical protein J7T54_003344 [Emericellopsis cladophorae]
MATRSLVLLGLSSLAAAQTTIVSLLYAGGKPEGSVMSASVIGIGDDATTYSLTCIPTESNKLCLGGIGTITQGPSTFEYSFSTSDSELFETLKLA